MQTHTHLERIGNISSVGESEPSLSVIQGFDRGRISVTQV